MRIPASEIVNSPYRMICSLERQSGGAWKPYGSGFLIGRTTVLTAAHNVSYFGATIVDLRARFGRDGDSSLKDIVCRVEDQKPNPAYFATFAAEHDFAILRLAGPVGDELSWFQLRSLSNAEIASLSKVRVAGYPGSPLPGTTGSPGGRELWQTSSAATGAGKFVSYAAGTAPGQSGGPVFLDAEDAKASGTFDAVGLHLRADSSSGKGRALRVTPSLLDAIQELTGQ